MMDASIEFYLVLLLSGLLVSMLLWRLEAVSRSCRRYLLELLLFRGLCRDHFHIFEQVPVATERGVTVLSYVLVSRFGVIVIEIDDSHAAEGKRIDGFACHRRHFQQQRIKGALARELEAELPLIKGLLLCSESKPGSDSLCFSSVIGLYRWLLQNHPQTLRIKERLQIVSRLQRMKRYLPALVAMSDSVRNKVVPVKVVDIELARVQRRRGLRSGWQKRQLRGSGHKI